jgi:hypothetical protein
MQEEELPPELIPLQQVNPNDLANQAIDEYVTLLDPILIPAPEPEPIAVQENEGIQEELVQDQVQVQEQEVQAALEIQPNLAMIPLQELVHVPEEMPRRSSRLAKKSQGLYINAMDKAMRKKKKEAVVISNTSKSGKSSSTSGHDQEENSKITPPIPSSRRVDSYGGGMWF